ncbi:hypothetical protein Hanom_Chr04g00290371 [Helianthus anomalus]
MNLVHFFYLFIFFVILTQARLRGLRSGSGKHKFTELGEGGKGRERGCLARPLPSQPIIHFFLNSLPKPY